MQEAARFRLLRLGSTLRTATEELARFAAHDAAFSRTRLIFFLSRAWLLSRGLAHALQTADESEYDRLTWSPPTQPLPKVEAVCVGAAKRVAAGAFVAFEFRLRAVADAAPVTAGQRLTWSAVFPLKPGQNIPPEGFLHLPQKQKFTPFILLDRKTVTIEHANLVSEESGGRLALTDRSTVTPGNAFREWDRFLDWEPAPAVERIRQHVPGPLGLDTELQEEIVLREYAIGAPGEGDGPGKTVYRITAGGLTLSAIVGPEAEGKALRENLEELRREVEKEPPAAVRTDALRALPAGVSAVDGVPTRTGLPHDLEGEREQGGLAQGHVVYVIQHRSHHGQENGRGRTADRGQRASRTC
jgi:hypothetical protein